MNIQRTAGFKLFQLTTYDSSFKTVNTLATVSYMAYAGKVGWPDSCSLHGLCCKSWTASVWKLWTVSAMKTCTSSNKTTSKCKNNWCIQVQLTCKPLQSHFSSFKSWSLHRRLKVRQNYTQNRVKLEVIPILSAGPFRSALSIIFPQPQFRHWHMPHWAGAFYGPGGMKWSGSRRWKYPWWGYIPIRTLPGMTSTWAWRVRLTATRRGSQPHLSRPAEAPLVVAQRLVHLSHVHIRTACCCLKQSTHPCRNPSQSDRTCRYKPTATAHASECATPPYRGPQHSWHKLPVQNLGWTLRWWTWSLSRELNARMPVPMRLS